MDDLNLSELGLTNNETKAYRTLLNRGKLGAGDVSRFSQVSYSRIYDVLASLEQKGFIKIIPEKSKKFVPTDPASFEEIIKKKREDLDKIQTQIKKMKESYSEKQKMPVILGYGKPAFYKILKDMPKPKKYEYNIKWSSEYRPEWERDYFQSIRGGIDNRVLCRYNKETSENIHKWIKAGRKKIKKFDNRGAVFSIVDDEVLITLINQNVTLLIRDEAFADVMSRLFLETYKNAEEIK
jgi:sugar-specific transcriptional regulator TrmB